MGASRWFFVSLTAVFIVLVIVVSFLFYSHEKDVTANARNRLVTAELERSKEQARVFAEKVQEAIGRTRFSELAKGAEGKLLNFRRLTDMMMAQNNFVAYIHLQDENGETLIYKGPKAIQKIVVKSDSVTFMERTTENISFIHLDGKEIEGEDIHDITTILLGADDRSTIGKLSVGVSENRLKNFSTEAVSANTYFTYPGLAFLVFCGAFGLIWFYYVRVSALEKSLANEKRLAYVGSLASGLVHELRNPINAMNLNLSLLEEDLSSLDDSRHGSMKKILNRIKPGLQHLEHVSTEFLNFAKPQDLNLEPVFVNDVVREVCSFLSEEFRYSLVDVETDLDDTVGNPVTDRSRLRKVLLNLMSNGAQAMNEGGILKVTTKRTGGGLKITVADTGPGISDQARENLFALFYTTKIGGVGLGLPIVKRMVADLKGTVDISKIEPHGTVFIVNIPVMS